MVGGGSQWRDALHTLRRPPVEVPAITGADLKAAVHGMWSGVSEGPDGLTYGDAVRIPVPAWDRLAEVLAVCEEHGWPDYLVLGRVVSLPKTPDSPPVVDPADLRPITVLALAVRAWGKARCVHLREWTAGWADPCQAGMWGHAGSEVGAWRNGLRLEAARLGARLRVGVSFDLSKAFDRVSWTAVAELFSATGVPRQLAFPKVVLLHRQP